MSRNLSLNRAKKKRDDEFYTQYKTVEKMLLPFLSNIRNLKVCCAFDSYDSAFCEYMRKNSISYTYTSSRFGTPEWDEIVVDSDIVITNPPFSIFNSIIQHLASINKDFILIAPVNSLIYQNVFRLIKSGLVQVNHLGTTEFLRPDKNTVRLSNCVILSTISLNHPFHRTEKREASYRKFSNYNCLFIDKCIHILDDYDGLQAVPLSFLEKINNEQFEIMDYTKNTRLRGCAPISKEISDKMHSHYSYGMTIPYIIDDDGKPVVPYNRIIIRRRND